MVLWYCALHLIKQNCSLKLFFKNSNRHGSSNSLVAFPSRTNHKLHSTLLTPELDRKAITNFDSSKTSGSDCIILVVLKNWEPENLRILPELLNMCAKEFVFQIPRRSHLLSLPKNVGEMSTAKNYRR